MDKVDRKASRARSLARHEVELWEQVTRHVKPMRSSPKISPVSVGSFPPSKTPHVPAQVQSTPVKPAPSPLKPLVRVEAGVLRRLSRGQGSPEAKIDLHGMRQAEAHAALRSFIHRAHADGVRLILVVTGKGVREPGALLHEERGVLRRSLPHWLAAPDLRSAVLGFEEAARRHGGEGAFYVQLRGSSLRKLRQPS